MSKLTEVFLEHQEIITQKIAAIKHVDLWAEQISFLSDEHNFPTPAIFLSYRILSVLDQSLKSQTLKMGVDVKYFYETFFDTNRGSKKQNKALAFLHVNDEVFKAFHATSGTHFSEMRRIGLAPVETGSAGVLWEQRFEFIMVENSAFEAVEETDVENVSVERGTPTENNQDNNLYDTIETT